MSPISIVNGYVCFNCTDTAFAKRNVDPRNPTDDPAKQTPIQRASPTVGGAATAVQPAGGSSSLRLDIYV